MDSSQNAAYLRGLVEGMKLDKATPERELIHALVDAVTSLAEENQSLQLQLDDLSDEVELLDSGINSVLDLLEDDDDEDDDEGCGCGGCHKHGAAEDEKLELPCPVCGDTIDISDQMYEDGRFICPHCDAKLEVDMGHSHGDGEGCGCEHDH